MKTCGFNPPDICYDPITITALVATGIAGAAASSAVSNSQQRKEAARQEESRSQAGAVADQAIAKTPQVENNKPAETPDSNDKAKRIGRAALISTSPLGVQTTDPTGRRKLLGNM